MWPRRSSRPSRTCNARRVQVLSRLPMRPLRTQSIYPTGIPPSRWPLEILGRSRPSLSPPRRNGPPQCQHPLRAAAIGSALAGHLCVLHRGHVRPDPAVFLALSAFPILFVRPRATAMPRPRLVPWATSRDQTAPPPASRIAGVLFVDRLRRAPHLAIHRGAGGGPDPKEVPVQPGQVRLRTPADEGISAHEVLASARPRIATRCCRGASSPRRSFRCAAASGRIPRCRLERGSHASRPKG